MTRCRLLRIILPLHAHPKARVCDREKGDLKFGTDRRGEFSAQHLARCRIGTEGRKGGTRRRTRRVISDTTCSIMISSPGCILSQPVETIMLSNIPCVSSHRNIHPLWLNTPFEMVSCLRQSVPEAVTRLGPKKLVGEEGKMAVS